MKKFNSPEEARQYLKSFIERSHTMDTKKVHGPFSEKEVDNINMFQTSGFMHPFTCCSYDGCNREDKVLVADKSFLTCPCGRYKQRWCYKYMTEFDTDEKQ